MRIVIAALALAALMLSAPMSVPAEAGCTVKTNSGSDVTTNSGKPVKTKWC